MEFRKAAKEARKQKDFYRTFEAAEEVLARAADAEATIVALDKNIMALLATEAKKLDQIRQLDVAREENTAKAAQEVEEQAERVHVAAATATVSVTESERRTEEARRIAVERIAEIGTIIEKFEADLVEKEAQLVEAQARYDAFVGSVIPAGE